jgi:hypothetical protein
MALPPLETISSKIQIRIRDYKTSSKYVCSFIGSQNHGFFLQGPNFAGNRGSIIITAIIFIGL